MIAKRKILNALFWPSIIIGSLLLAKVIYSATSGTLDLSVYGSVADHPFWGRPEIFLTPHISSLTNPKKVCPDIVENYRRVQSGRPLMHRVDAERGY